MFCSDCGSKATGRFCWQCGAKLHEADSLLPSDSPKSGQDSSPSVECMLDVTSESETLDWSDVVDYERLLSIEAVRRRIAHAGKKHEPGISGEQFLAVFDSIVPTGVSLEKLTAILQPIYGKLGVRTGQSERWTIAAPAGETLVAVLCALAASGHGMKAVEQSSDHCDLRTTIPSSLWALTGELVVTVVKQPRETVVGAKAEVKGQFFDWGHCRRTLGRLHTRILEELSLPVEIPGSGDSSVRKAA